MCKANGVKVNDSFVLKLIWEDANPVFKFYSKVKHQHNFFFVVFFCLLSYRLIAKDLY